MSEKSETIVVKIEDLPLPVEVANEIDLLYADHEIKEEMVIGPVVFQQAVCNTSHSEDAHLPEKTGSESQDEKTEQCYPARETRNETGTEQMTSNDCNENAVPKLKQNINFKCKECTYQSVTENSLERHLKLHDKTRRFPCDVCGYRYWKKGDLQQHMKYTHSGEKQHKCGTCDYKTNNIYRLNAHLRTHSGEMPYSCSQCEFKFSYKTSFIRHLRIHTGEKPYSCSVCEYRFNEASCLKKHLRTHTGEKPFSCSECEYKCSVKSSLKTHLLKHTGEKRFSCSQCEYKSSNKKNLKRHSSKHKVSITYMDTVTGKPTRITF